MADVWKHMPGHPGYFVTEAGDKQMAMMANGKFAIMGTQADAQGRFLVLSKPSGDPVKLGIPQALADEGELLCVDAAIERALAGKPFEMVLANGLGDRRRKPRRN